VSIYLGQTQGIDVLSALALQIFWIVVLAFLARLVWGRAMRRVVIQGG
jgi:ABC-2 type transport system permease protein